MVADDSERSLVVDGYYEDALLISIIFSLADDNKVGRLVIINIIAELDDLVDLREFEANKA